MALKGDRELSVAQPLREEVREMHVVHAARAVKVDLGEHGVAGEQQGLCRLEASLGDPQLRRGGLVAVTVALVLRRLAEDAYRVHKPEVVKTPIRDAGVVRITQ